MKAAALLLAACLCGCVAAPVQSTPAVPVPAAWQTPLAGEAAATETSAAAFWAGFGNAPLQALLQQTAAGNPDLQIAANRLLMARDNAQLAGALQSPAVNVGAGLVDSTAVAVTQNRNPAIYRLGLDASYELDFWGRIQSLVASADANTAASRFDLETARLSLDIAVAQQVFDLSEADEVLMLLQRRQSLAAERLKLEAARFAAGRVDQQATLDAQRAVAAMQAEQSDWQRQRQQHEWQLALLAGELPQGFSVSFGALRQAIQLPLVPAGLPSSLLQRRPDVRSAAERLHAAQANTGVARAEQFPQIRLTAELGIATDVLRKYRGVGLFGVGPEISLPLLDGGARAAKVDLSLREVDIAQIEYRKAGLAAFADVERALLMRQGLLEQQQQLARVEQQQQQDGQRLSAQLQAGRKSRLDVIAAEDAQAATTLQVIHNYREQLDGLLALHAAFGGGWHAAEEPTSISLR